MNGSKYFTAAVFTVTLGALWTGSALAQSSGPCGLPNGTAIYALTTDNVIFMFRQGAPRTERITGIDGNLTGIDFRVSDGPPGQLYGITDTGKLYRISLGQNQLPVLISSIAPRFAAGFQALADFNPVVAPNANALRLIGSNDQNFAVVDNGGTLNATAVQTPVSYAAGDLNVGVDPNLTAGAYDNNAVGATFTTFYAIDYDLDALVTIADRNATGSSNTAGGKLRTIGPLVDAQGRPINFAPNAGMDVFTQLGSNGLPIINQAIAISGRTLYCIGLGTLNPSLPPGTRQNVLAVAVAGSAQPGANPNIVTGGFTDVAVNPF
jgi:hypothetical protein